MRKPQPYHRFPGALFFVAIALSSSGVHALTFDLGVSFSQPVLELRNENDTLLGQNASETSVWPSISLQSKERYFDDSNWGYSLSAMAWYFSMDKQKVGDEVVDYGTSMKGYYAYLTPTFYYRFGDKYIMESKDKWNWTLGIGLGVGFLVADGETYTNRASTPTTESVNVDNAALSSGIFIEAVKNRWFFRFSSYGPSADMNATRKVRLNDNSIIFGRRFDLKEFLN